MIASNWSRRLEAMQASGEMLTLLKKWNLPGTTTDVKHSASIEGRAPWSSTSSS